MMRNGNAVDVLIAGAGPVGLFLANECARRGLTWRMVEQNSTQSEHSKALAIFPRTVEIFDMAGVAEPFMKAANRVTTVQMVTHGRTLARLHFQPEESPYSFVSMVPQNVTEQILVEELQKKGGRVEYETKFVTATQHEDEVSVTLEKNGQREEVTARYVVGCDGAHSAVRHRLALPFEGAEYKDLFILADVETNELPADAMQLCPSELGPVAIFPMSATRRRIVATVNEEQGDAPSLQLVREVLAQRAPADIQANDMHWSSYFRIHHRHVGQLRMKRMFIAGDAAHIHSPFGGQGMNTGLHDVWNLAWKLTLAVNGRATETLLASYNDERLPVIKQVIDTTHFLTKALGTPNKLAQALRDAVIPMVSRLAPFQHAFVQRLSELGIHYNGSPIVEGAGERFFDDSVRGGKGLLNQFVLFMDAKQQAAGAAASKQLQTQFGDVLEVRAGNRDGLTLVRPDGYIAYSARHLDEAAFTSIAALLARQTGICPPAQRAA